MLPKRYYSLTIHMFLRSSDDKISDDKINLEKLVLGGLIKIHKGRL